MMDNYQNIARLLIITGFILLIVGVIFLLIPRVPFLGKLPGDINIERKNFNFYFPLTTCIILSILISLILIIIRSLRGH